MEDFSQYDQRTKDIIGHAMCFLHPVRADGTKRKYNEVDDKVEHFWCLVNLFWGKGSAKHFVRTPWAEKMVEELCSYKFLALSGCADCVAGETRIANPITGEQPTIQYLCENGIAPTVMTLNGPVKAGVPFLKGKDDLFRVELKDGNSFSCTLGHVVLSDDGFVPVSTLRPGQYLLGCGAIHQESISDTFPLTHGQGVLNSRKRVEDCQDDYSVCSCLDGEQLPLGADIDQSFSPLPICVQSHKGYAFSHGDGLENKPTHNRPYQSFCHPSILDFYHRVGLLETFSSHRFATETLLHETRSFQSFDRFHSTTGLVWPDQAQGVCSCHKQEFDSSYKIKVARMAVSAIKKIGRRPFYDLTVPIAHHYFAEGAIHHNSGKTDTLAVWGLLNWFVAPLATMVLVTSTSLKESRKRIWGSIREYFLAAEGFPGKLVDSIGQITCGSEEGLVTSDKAGLALIAGDKSKETESIGKLIGFKNQRVFLLADELPELSENLIKAATSNLSGRPYFQMVGSGNFKSIYDPFGTFTKPKAGWGSVTIEDTEWETDRGKCIRFDGTKSPNIILGQDVWPIYNSKNLREHERLGQHSALFWRMCRSFPCPEGSENAIYSESDLLAGKVHDQCVWMGDRIRVAAMDPSFTAGGDRCPLMFGWLGMTRDGIYTLAVDKYFLLTEDLRLKDQTRAFQIASQIRENCIREGVAPYNFALDVTGPSIVFGEVVAEVWSSQVLRVQFGGVASDAIVSETDTRPGKEAYVNRVSELWYAGLAYVRSNQIRGMPAEVAKELCSRRYETVKSLSMKVRVEPKVEMKKRIGISPDLADTWAILLDLCRQRHNFTAGAGYTNDGSRDESWEDMAIKAHEIYEDSQPVYENAYP